MNSNTIPFIDHNQAFWQLASIQSAALGIPGMIVGSNIAQHYGNTIALASIIIGNLLLWFIGISVIGTANLRINAFENFRTYIGKSGTYAFVVVIAFAFLGWYNLQTKVVAEIISYFFDLSMRNQIRIGAILGVLVTFFSMGGIRLIKWLCICSLPLLLAYFFYIFLAGGFNQAAVVDNDINGLIPGIIAVVFVVLPGTLNLPTFFRHSKTKSHSFFALTLFTLLTGLFQYLSVWAQMGSIQDISSSASSPLVVVSFSILSFFCTNTVNIYFASGALELLVNRKIDARDYAVIGLIGTGAFVLLQAFPLMTLFENIINGVVGSFCIVLLATILIKIIVNHRPRVYERVISNSCWLVGAIASLYYLLHQIDQPNYALMAGIGFSGIAFLVVLFFEETIWAFKQTVIKRFE